MVSVFNGLFTGLLLQFAVGPVFFYILGITMDSSYFNSLCAIAAVTLVDCFYITLSLLGIGKFLHKDSNVLY
jgi:threonine/homoserine/homoserine lactone efflux protein